MRSGATTVQRRRSFSSSVHSTASSRCPVSSRWRARTSAGNAVVYAGGMASRYSSATGPMQRAELGPPLGRGLRHHHAFFEQRVGLRRTAPARAQPSLVLHAAGPGRARVADREHVEQLETVVRRRPRRGEARDRVLGRRGRGGSRCRRAGGGCRTSHTRTSRCRRSSSPMPARHRRPRSRRRPREWSPRIGPCRCRGAARRAAAGPVAGRRAPSGRRGRPRGRGSPRDSATASSEMPVDGEAVVRVALRPAPARAPIPGSSAHEHAHVVERLEHGNGTAPGRQHVA